MTDTLPRILQFTTDSGIRIYRIPCQVFPKLVGFVYLVLGLDRPILVDTGSGEEDSLPQILAGIDHVRQEFAELVDVADIGTIILTHGHTDHIGGCAGLLDRIHGDVEVMIHRFDARAITHYDARAVMTNHLFGRFLRSTGLAFEYVDEVIERFGFLPGRVRSIADVTPLDDGLSRPIDGMEIVHTPGHSPGHICLRIEDYLLSGDHVLARTLSQPWPESIAPHTGLWHYLDSLDRVEGICRKAHVSKILAGHEEVIDDPLRRIASIKKNQQRRLDRVVQILQESPEPMNLTQIVRRMYLTPQGTRNLLALTDIGARVEYLWQQDLVCPANLEEIIGSKRAGLSFCRYPTKYDVNYLLKLIVIVMIGIKQAAHCLCAACLCIFSGSRNRARKALFRRLEQ